MIRTVRNKPTKAAREATRQATQEDYAKLVQAVVKNITLKKRDIILKFPYFVQLAEDFPRGILVKRTTEFNFYRCKCFKIMDWLHKHSYSSYDAKAVVRMQRSVVNLWGQVDKWLDGKNLLEYTDKLEFKEELDGTDSCDDEAAD